MGSLNVTPRSMSRQPTRRNIVATVHEGSIGPTARGLALRLVSAPTIQEVGTSRRLVRVVSPIRSRKTADDPAGRPYPEMQKRSYILRASVVQSSTLPLTLPSPSRGEVDNDAIY